MNKIIGMKAAVRRVKQSNFLIFLICKSKKGHLKQLVSYINKYLLMFIIANNIYNNKYLLVYNVSIDIKYVYNCIVINK